MEQRVSILELTVRCDICRNEFKMRLDPIAAIQMSSTLPEGTSRVATVCPDCRANRITELHLYDAAAGDRVRIAIPYGGQWRHLFWVRVSRDGDVYCTFGHGEHLEVAKTGSTTSDSGKVEVKYAQSEDRDVVGPLKGGRVSFHASGAINLGDRTIQGIPLSQRTEQQILCSMVFEHPSTFPPVGEVRERDVLLQFAIAEDRALVGAVHFVPRGRAVDLAPGIQEIGEPRRQLLIRFSGLTNAAGGEMTLHVVLGRGPGLEAWPPMSYLLAPARVDGD